MLNKEPISPYNLRLPKALKKRLEIKAQTAKRSLNKHIIFVLENSVINDEIDPEKKEIGIALKN